MPTSKKLLHEKIRAKYMELFSTILAQQNEQVLITGSNEISVPCVDSEGNEEFIVITFKVPIGSREGEIYDGYSIAQDYILKQTQKTEAAAIAAAKKQRKIVRDIEARKQKAEAKAKYEKEKLK